MVDVVVVGAGPIGLLYAWSMKKINPALNIVIYEKYSEYQRKHTLVMKWEHMEAMMKATETENHPRLKPLLERLKKDPHIRTSELEELYKDLSQETESGFDPSKIIIEEITEENIREKVLEAYPDAKMIIGADGTHSVVSQSFFGEENQVKHEFDYVLQLRYEINGEYKDSGIATAAFYQEMARNGLIANEYVGHYADGKTPITMQMMISKEVFQHLTKVAVSKKPIYLNSDDKDKIPEHIRHFLSRYLEHKIQKCHKERSLIDMKTVRVSVNEAPATHAKQVSKQVERQDGSRVNVQLVGDASLGLSYFMGLNAGNEAAAIFIGSMKEQIKDKFANTEAVEAGLAEYQKWFTEEFAPRKVNQVSQYSKRNIRIPMRFMEKVALFKGVSVMEDNDASEGLLNAYFNLQQAPAHEVRLEKEWRKYPHRSYDPVRLGDWSYIPVRHHLKKIIKLFTDFFTPYKSTDSYYPLKQDMRQPLMGLANLGSGFAKTLVGLFTLNPWRFVDGVFSLLRGGIEIVTTPLTWLLKPITRGFSTMVYKAIWGPKRIEDNSSMRKIAKLGRKSIDQFEETLKDHEPSAQSTYDILAMCDDMHRKFKKAMRHTQITDIAHDEHIAYKEVMKDGVVDPKAVRQYFSLFNQKPQMETRNYDSAEHQTGLGKN
ncbi:Kynurenine 3-monooxygenase [Legionella birminghamensis]|uniref:Kynurenine 3-monooxygenase n=1 Tax=Legionella birminghamensis TaxID=28083 RepID=A0A378IDY9_9GAMM|nr:hypothetical protein [Legionella birminghamensis]KTC66837.1 Kynurenine 3-monooxygenase [Legionella birminghamensis]STX32962.1 Uncharacterised protein [Legionella birminghamensis]